MESILNDKDIAVLTLSNSHGMAIKVNDSGDGVFYQYSDEEEPKEAEIEYIEDTEDILGWNTHEEDNMQPAFTTEQGHTYFIGQFMRVNIGG